MSTLDVPVPTAAGLATVPATAPVGTRALVIPSLKVNKKIATVIDIKSILFMLL